MGSCQSQSVNNDWGVIHNQSNKDLICILHSTELVGQEALVKKGAGGEMGVDLEKGVNINANASYDLLTKQQKETNDGKLTVKAGRITSVGLTGINFDTTRFISIFTDEQPKQAIYTSAKLSGYDDVRIKIRKDFSHKLMAQQESLKIQKIARGQIYHQVKDHKCPQCKEKSDLMLSLQGVECKSCKEKNSSLFVCREFSTSHLFCEKCDRQAANLKK